MKKNRMLIKKKGGQHLKKMGGITGSCPHVPVARNMKMELLTVSVENLWTQNTRIIHDV